MTRVKQQIFLMELFKAAWAWNSFDQYTCTCMYKTCLYLGPGMADLDVSFIDRVGLGRVRAHGKLGHLLDQGVIGINRTKSPERCPRGSTGQGGTDREKDEENRAFEHGSPL